MTSESSSTIMPSDSITSDQALEFLKTNDLEIIKTWEKSSQILTNNVYHRQITFTSNVFLPLTFLCRNSCDYCGFRRSRMEQGKEYFAPERIDASLVKAKRQGVSEVLITLGEKPEMIYPEAKHWLSNHGFNSTVEYAHFISKKTLDHELLTHINAGTLTYEELADFRDVAASIGLMFETGSERLTKLGMPHGRSPDKHPKKRIQTIKNAGRLRIPFTSGILIGIGETLQEIVTSLFTLKKIHLEYGHLQEVILQNFQPHPDSVMANFPPPAVDLLEKVLIIARHILPSEISIQIPPNLSKGHEQRFIRAGMSDWGGISSITHDYINPDHNWPQIAQLEHITREGGYHLRERLPVYPRYINLDWLSSRIYNLIIDNKLVTKDGYRKR
ncbi:MAG: 7,8-didemethyl-8-hydroxy-5-deazariboflavin synthase CofG [Candidatus Hodarchaeales archaeon]